MSASLLHYALGIRGIQQNSAEFIDGTIRIYAALDQSKDKCPLCKNSFLHFKDSKKRIFQTPPIGNKPSWLHLTIRRRYCPNCCNKWWPQPLFVSGQRRMTRSFEAYIIRLTAAMTLQDVADFLDISWHTVKDIHKEYLRKKYDKPFDFSQIIYLGIDEFSIGKNHEYMTIFTNLQNTQIIHAIEGRSKEAITPFLKKLSKKAINLQAVAMDMSGPYKSAVNEFLPFVPIVFDRFHVMKLMNKAIDEIRREQQSVFKKQGINALKGSRYLLLRNIESLDPENRTTLEVLLKMNAPLSCAHMMKEQLREFWNQPNRQASLIFLVNWIYSGGFETGITQIIKVARTLLRHYSGLANYYDHKITNAVTEGVNNKIETLKRQAYGYRDMEYFKLRLYHLHKQKSELLG